MIEYRHTVSQEQHGKRLDTLLSTLDGIKSRAEAVRYIEQGTVYLNGNPITAKKHLVSENDELVYEISPEQPIALAGEDIRLDIRYEDEDILVLSKPAGLVVHPAFGHSSGTLVNALIAHCGYDNLALLQGDDRPGIVHRLDKDTSGLMLAAKRDESGRILQDGIRHKRVERYYLALTHGLIAPDTGLIDAPLMRAKVERQKIIVNQAQFARQSITEFVVHERFEANHPDEGYTLLECNLYTGRTHQIRAHMEYIGHPCVGDLLYGLQNRPQTQQGLERQFLHSWHLFFRHPVTNAEMEFFDPLPSELRAVISSLAPRSMGRTETGACAQSLYLPA